MNFPLNVEKAIQAIGVLFRHDGVKSMNYMRLLKLLYIADRNAIQESGRAITGGPVLAKERGPVPGSNFQYSGWTTEANHLGNVAYRTGKKIEWDYKNLRATNAPEAAPFIKRPEYRKGWNNVLKFS